MRVWTFLLPTGENVPREVLQYPYKVENGRYRFAKVYGGLNWNPELRAPLTEPGVDVKAGEYLLAVGGKDLKYPEDLYSRFEQTAGRTITISLQNEDHTQVVQTWKLLRARIIKHISGPFNAKGTDVAMEELTLAYERLEME